MTVTPPRRRRARRPLAFATATTGIVAIVVGVIVLSSRPVVVPPPAPSVSLPPPSVADQPRAAVDGSIIDGDLAHDSRDDLYRTPFGAVGAGASVTLRLRAAAGDLSGATVRVLDDSTGASALVPMTVAATDGVAGTHGYDYWEATLDTTGAPRVLGYRFIATDGSAIRYIEDDPVGEGGRAEGVVGSVGDGGPGGSGRVSASSGDGMWWQPTIHDPTFTTPAWARGAVVYQVFADRFFNADPSGDPSPDDRVYGYPVILKAWTDAPEGACQAHADAAGCTEQPLGRDFFGGDLQGITDKLDDLRDAGVTVLGLDPVFAAASNHGEDTQDYRIIDPDLGSAAAFERLVTQAREKGIRVVLDGVFDHVSADSPWFDRFGRFTEVGACERADSPYRALFTFEDPPVGGTGACAPSVPGGTDRAYATRAGDANLPALSAGADVDALLSGSGGVVGSWLSDGAAGWRLVDVDALPVERMRAIRSAIKAVDPEALIIGATSGGGAASVGGEGGAEQLVGGGVPWLLGDALDSTLNDAYRRAVIGLFNGPTEDPGGAIPGLTPSAFAARMEGVREDHPSAAWEILVNAVDSRDTARILWTLTPGAELPADKEAPDNLAVGKAKLRTLAALHLTWPGMASITYGTEVGITGAGDPDSRRTYPWDARDDDLRDWYRTLGRLRADHEALRTGDLRFVNVDDDARTLAFARRSPNEAAVTALNLSDQARDVVLALDGIVPPGIVLVDDLGDLADATVGTDGTATVRLPPGGVALFITRDGEDLTPPGTPTGLTATAAPGQVELVWAAPTSDDAVSYRIWRSLVSGGGFVPIADTVDRYFVDPTVRNGTGYHYVITALDTAGNVGPRSIEAAALPSLTIAEARLAGPAAVTQSGWGAGAATATPIAALVRVDNVTNLSGPTVGIVAQLGFGPIAAAGVPDPGPAYTWSDMAFESDVAAEGADRLIGTVSPTAAGSYGALVRVSTDGRRTWRYADLVGLADPTLARAPQPVVLTVTPGSGASASP